ncbi:hypothetical protein TruAng_012054 [Truncatella angustata]|nr:hypothetical protein TruAng_012054 [Truncatella angustata]
MRHKIGAPLRDRTFPVLQLTAAVVEGGGGAAPEFVVVSIPVPDFGESESSRLASEKGAQVASYVSVERIRKLESGKIEWLMATASDAGGVLPQFVQNMAMPGIVWKDVPLFLGWIAKERQKRDIARDGVAGRGQRERDVAVPASTAAQDTLLVATGPDATTAHEVSIGDAASTETKRETEVSTGPEVTNLPGLSQADTTTEGPRPEVTTNV